MDIYEIAELIRSERKKKGWTQAELGRRSGISRQLVAEFENEHLDEIGFKKMGRMCMALKLEITVAPIDPARHAEVEAIRRVEELQRTDRMIADAMKHLPGKLAHPPK